MAGTARSPGRMVTVCVLAAVALAATLAVTGAATEVEALLVGLTAITATLVVDGTARAERRFRLRARLSAADWLPGPVLSVSTATAQIMERYAEREIVVEARRHLAQLTTDFEELARGRIVRPGTDYELLLTGTGACHRLLEAVTVIGDGPGGTRWWDSEPGQRYWRANLAALGRGVGITRVFVCTGLNPDLARLISEQSEAGVRTLLAPMDGLDPVPRRGFTVWDRRRGWETRSGQHAAPDQNIFTVNEEDLDRLLDTFHACADAAHEVTP